MEFKSEMFVVRTHRQHTSVVMVIPKLLKKKLSVEAGDYVVFEETGDKGVVTMKKLYPEGLKDGKVAKRTHRKARGRKS